LVSFETKKVLRKESVMDKTNGAGGPWSRIKTSFSNFGGALKLFFFKRVLKAIVPLFYLSDNGLLRVVF
jgi:hypothetical protein